MAHYVLAIVRSEQAKADVESESDFGIPIYSDPAAERLGELEQHEAESMIVTCARGQEEMLIYGFPSWPFVSWLS